MKSYIQLLNVCLFVIFHHVHSASVAILLDTCELQAMFTKTGNLNVFYLLIVMLIFRLMRFFNSTSMKRR